LKKSIIFGIVTLALAAVLTGCGRSGKVLAKVNDDTITEDDLFYALDMARTVRVVTPDGQRVEAQVDGRLGYQLLQEIIKRKLTVQLAQDQGVAPTEKDIDAEIAFQTSLDPDFMKKQSSAGIVLSRTREDLKYRLSLDRILTKGIKVTNEDAKKFIAQNPKQFMEPETVNLLWILIPKTDTAIKSRIDADLLAGQSFSSLAVQYSKAPNASTLGGRFPINEVERLPEAVKKLVKTTAVSRSTGWIESQEGFAKFFIESKKAAQPINMTASKIEWVRRQMALMRGRQAIDINDQIVKKLKASEKNIKIENKSLSDLWATSFKEFIRTQNEAGSTANRTNDTGGLKAK
jgi:parvulin-like peptidyl-prolyl isomerase